MKKYSIALIVLLVIDFSALAQEDSSGRIPEYNIPYELPSVENIKDILNRIRVYYEESSNQSVVDSKTGEQITDFKSFNIDAVPSKGFSSEWSYTHGVVLSAFEYIDDVIDDDGFFENNIKFYDYVANNLPYFQKNKDKIHKEKRW